MRPAVLFPALSPGCLLTIILLMRALDPLRYEKETLQYFQTLKAGWVCGSWHGAAQHAGGGQLTHSPCALLSLPSCGPNEGSVPR